MKHRAFYVLLSLATAALYLAMVLWSLPEITIEADGLRPFDLRPLGYSAAQAEAFLNALSGEGRVFYAQTQHWLDTLFPALLACWGVWTLWLFYTGPLRWVLIVLAVLGAGFDYAENTAVADLLSGFDADRAALASRWTVLKSLAATAVYAAILWAVGRWIWSRRRR